MPSTVVLTQSGDKLDGHAEAAVESFWSYVGHVRPNDCPQFRIDADLLEVLVVMQRFEYGPAE
jgi:hypothetical protein